MFNHSFSSAENRLLSFARGRRAAVAASNQQQQVHQQALAANQATGQQQSQQLTQQYWANNPTAQPNRGDPYSSGPGNPNYNINYDPTFVGNRNADSGYQGDPYYGDFRQGAEAYANSLGIVPTDPGVSRNPEAERMALEAAKQTYYAKVQAEQQRNALAQDKARKGIQGTLETSQVQAPSTGDINAKANVGTTVAQRGALRGAARQKYIDDRRALGIDDQTIKQELSSPPPAVQTPPPIIPNDQTPAPTATNEVPTQTGQKGTTETNQTPDNNVPVAPNPTSSAFRNMASLAVDPLEKMLMTSYADMIDSSPAGGQPGTYSDFLASADGRSVAQGYNDANSILTNYQSTVEASKNSRQKFSQDQFDRNDAYLAAAKANADAQLQFANDKGARDLAESNRKNLNKMSNALAFQGGFGSAGGNMEVLDAYQKGEQAIVDLNKEYGFKRTDVSLQFTQMHNEAYDNFRSSWLEAQDNFDTRIADIATQKNSNETSKRSALKSAFTERNKSITDANLAHAKAINDATKGVGDYINKQRDDKRADEEAGWSLFNTAFDNYKGNIPQAILDQVKKKIPGFDTTNLRKGGQGGGGFGGLPSYTPGVSPTLGVYDSMSPQDFKSAVDRVVLKFGGTGGERNAKRNEYMTRLSSGESKSSIAQSMITDYWVSKGKDQPHDDRLNAASSMDLLQSYADAYGITETDDGPLGIIDAKTGWLASWVGLSSPAYNDISGIVGAAKGAITRANAGTAVTPWELSLIKEYAPDMSLKGPKFLANIRNYKNLVNYLDQKQAAFDLGLPPPIPPAPVTYSGTAARGPAKFSNNDMSSLLSR